MKDRWWSLPGVVAVLGTLTIVSTVQWSLNSAEVALPLRVEVGRPVLASAHSPRPTRAAPLAPATSGQVVPAAGGVTQDVGTVVPPSRSVVSETAANSPQGATAGVTPDPDTAPATPTPASSSVAGVSTAPGAQTETGGASDDDAPGRTTQPTTWTTTPTTTESARWTTSTTTTTNPSGHEPGDS